MNTDSKQIQKVLERGVANVYPTREDLAKKLATGERIRMYVGVDPTGPSLHIGHAIQFRKLREFQDLGHEVILLIGSFTAMIGDPTDKSAARSQLTREEVLENAKTYKEQAAKILNFEGDNPAQIKFNDEWLSKMSFADVVDLASHFTVQQMSERDMFARRMEEGKPVYLHEFMYPLMQGYDSVAMDVDLELGGTDQLFNMLAGRTIMKAMTGKEKFVLTLQLLTNDEGKKMSKSEGGFIALNDAPEDMYGKLMAMDDSMILPYFEYATDVSADALNEKKNQLENGANPRDVKAELARTIVTMFHSEADADKAEAHFDAVFRGGEMPEEMDVFAIEDGMTVLDALVGSELVSSKSEGRRMLEQGAVKIDSETVNDESLAVQAGTVLQRGKRHFRRLI